jgi:hypothetical protein
MQPKAKLWHPPREDEQQHHQERRKFIKQKCKINQHNPSIVRVSGKPAAASSPPSATACAKKQACSNVIAKEMNMYFLFS